MVAFSEGFSDTASMTKSSDDRVEDEISVVDDTRALISSDSEEDSRSFCTSFFKREPMSADTFRRTTHEINALLQCGWIFVHERYIKLCVPRRNKGNSKSLLSVSVCTL